MYWYYIQPSSIKLNSELYYAHCNKQCVNFTSFHSIKILLLHAVRKYITESNFKKTDEILHNINLVLQKKLDIDSLNLNKKFWFKHNLNGLFIFINIKNNQKINSNEANEFLISFNKISNYIDKDLILTFDFIFRESIKSNSNILFVKK